MQRIMAMGIPESSMGSAPAHVVRAASFLAALCVTVLLIMALAHGNATCTPAYADDASARSSVLVLEAGLGDYESCLSSWLGPDAQEVAEKDGLKLTSTSSPQWFRQDGDSAAPATFVLGSPQTGHPLKSEHIIWALDQIRASGAQPKTFVVAMGATGLPLREYAEEMTDPKQSSRADLVGFAFCGTPQNGYAAMDRYPDLPIWNTIAQTVGLTASDLLPGSAYLKSLNEGVFPRVCRVLSVEGNIGDLGFGFSDGIASYSSDYPLADSLTSQSESITVNASIARAINLTGIWTPFVKSANNPQGTVDSQLCERLSGMDSYEVSPEVQASVQDFYSVWLGSALPVTHSSNVLALDLSGSMLDGIGNGQTKLTAAKSATGAYLQTIKAYSELPLSAPVDVSTYGFNTSAWQIASGFDDAAVQAINAVGAQGETNIGAVLQGAFARLQDTPVCADRHVLLLSDGASTRGMSSTGILADLAPKAKEAGIVIDTVGFGDVGESDSSFLEELSKATGGTSFRADDGYALKVAFLKSYYASLGLGLVDKELDAASASEGIGLIDAGSGALQIGIVSEADVPSVSISCDGAQVDESQCTVFQGDGIISVQVINPTRGDYAIDVSATTGKVHLFAVEERGVSKGANVVAQTADYSLLLIVIAGVAFVALLAFVIIRARKGAHARA